MRPKQIWRIDNVLIVCWRNYIVYLLHVICALSFALRACVCVYVNRIGFCVNYYHLISKAVMCFICRKTKYHNTLKALKPSISLAQSLFCKKKAYRSFSQREYK